MSLILGVSSGDSIYFNDHVMNIVSTSEDMRTMRVLFGGQNFDLNDASYTEVAKDVFAAVGKPRYEKRDTLARIAIDAPRSVKILRSVHKNYDGHH